MIFLRFQSTEPNGQEGETVTDTASYDTKEHGTRLAGKETNPYILHRTR